MDELLISGCASIAVVSAFAAVFLPEIAGESLLVRRLRLLKENTPVLRVVRTPGEEVAERLRAIEKRNRARKKVTLQLRLDQSGLGWSTRTVMFASMAVGVLSLIAVMLILGSPFVAVAVGIGAGWFAPQWFIDHKRRRRLAKFIEQLPDALDIISRGVLVGRSINDCVRTIAREAPEPVKNEFRLVELHTNTASLPEAAAHMAARVPVDETRFLAITLALASSEGGKIAETLSNLSSTLRERHAAGQQLDSKTSEQRMAVRILATMPYLVLLIHYMSKPEQVSLLWTTTIGQLALAACTLMILIGFLVLNKMTEFRV